MEIMVVIILVGILAGIGMVSFANVKEKGINREAISLLQLIQVAERNYRMEYGTYYPSSGTLVNNSVANRTLINTNLKLSISVNTNSNWTITLDTDNLRAQASRTIGGSRTWTIGYPAASSSEPTCSGSPCF